MGRSGNVFWGILVFGGLTILALIPFTFYFINSLSPTIIHGLSLAKVTGEFVEASTNQAIKVRVRVGPSGGCVWSNLTESISCVSHIPYKPTPETIHLPNNESITSCFPIALGKALALNHVTTALMGLSILAILVDSLILQGGISLAIVYLMVLFMWITFILETIYISVLHKRLDKINQGDNENGNWEYKVGEGYWFVLAATILVSLVTCGGNFTIDSN
ncbi:hypothetical protein V866_002589 [Kwoniella sp. B9012]